MEVRAEYKNNWLILKPIGALDMNCFDFSVPRKNVGFFDEQFEVHIVNCANQNIKPMIAIDFKDCTRLDQTAMGRLVLMLKRSSTYGGCLVLMNLNNQVRERFDVTRMWRVFDICTSEEVDRRINLSNRAQ